MRTHDKNALRCPACGRPLKRPVKRLENGLPVRVYDVCACGAAVTTREVVISGRSGGERLAQQGDY